MGNAVAGFIQDEPWRYGPGLTHRPSAASSVDRSSIVNPRRVVSLSTVRKMPIPSG